MLNPKKTSCTIFTQDLAEYNAKLYIQIDNTTLPINTHPKILRVTLDPNTHITNIATNARKS